MPLRPPDGNSDLIPVVLFPNEGRGFGHALTRRGAGGELPEGYDRTLNMTVRAGRVFSPSFGQEGRFARASQSKPEFLAVWSEAVGTPFALFPARESADSVVMRYKDGALSVEADATTAEYGTATFHDDGAGVEYLYAGTKTGSKLLNRRTPAGTWAQDNDVVAIHVVQAAGALWASVNNYQVKKCPAGLDPFVAANWGAAIQVGTNEAPIVRLGRVGPAPIVFKEDGIWVYDERENRFDNRYAVPRNANNFPFVADDGEGGIITSLDDGALVRIRQFGAIITVDPLREAWPWRDTPRGPIRDVAFFGHRFYALMGAGRQLHQPDGIRVYRTADFVSYTDLTSAVTDKSWATGGALGGMAATESLLIGFDDQFIAIGVLLLAVNTNSVTASIRLSTGGTDAGASWTAASTGFWDGTATRTTGGAILASFGQSTGQIVLDPDFDLSSWAKATLNGQTKYWMRISFSGALSATVTLTELYITPRRGAPDMGASNYAKAPEWEATGVLPKVLQGRLLDDGRIVWDDIWTLPEPVPAHRIAVGTPSALSPTHALLVLTQAALYLLPLPSLPEPSVAQYAPLMRDTSGQIMPTFYPSAVDLSGAVYRLEFIECWGMDFGPSDEWRVAFRWDDTIPWHRLPAQTGSYALFDLRPYQNRGSLLSVAVSINVANASGPATPSCRMVVAWLRQLPDTAAPQPERQIPQVV